MSAGKEFGVLTNKLIEKWNIMNVIAGDVSELIQSVISNAVVEIQTREKRIAELEARLKLYSDREKENVVAPAESKEKKK